MQRVITQLDEFPSHSARDNVFVTTLDTRIGPTNPPGMTADNRKAAIDAAEKTVRESVIPAYRRIRALLTEQMPTVTCWKDRRLAAARRRSRCWSL